MKRDTGTRRARWHAWAAKVWLSREIWIRGMFYDKHSSRSRRAKKP